MNAMKLSNGSRPPFPAVADQPALSGSVTAAFAMRLAGKKPVFTDDSTVKVFESALTAQAAQFGCETVVYVFMPDHCHVVLHGKSNKAQPLQAMKTFREVTHRWLQENHPDVKWSDPTQDHILREDEDISTKVEDILNNPVRRGMVKHWREYKFKGSTIYDLDSWLNPI
jgi:REP element-mobilizing transposase RayT